MVPKLAYKQYKNHHFRKEITSPVSASHATLYVNNMQGETQEEFDR